MTRWLYDDAMYRFGVPQPSYWEATVADAPACSGSLSTSASCDVAIIGGGYTGLSAAYHLCRDHQLDARVLEAGHIGWGASGRNGGFCSIGGASLGAEKMAAKYGLEHTRDYYRSQVAAVELVLDLLVNEHIDAERQGDSEVAIACSQSGFEHLKRYAEFQFRELGLDTKVIGQDAFRERYFDSPLQHGAVILKPTFGLHPLRYAQGLALAAERKGAVIYPNSEVTAWRKEGAHHVLTAGTGELRCKHVILATNGFAPEHLHRGIRGQALPMISAILVTRPLDDAELAAHAWQTTSPSITAVNLLNYFRLLPDRRILFGGRGSASGDDQSAVRNYQRLAERFGAVFPAWRNIDIDYRWHGLVCMTRRLTPAIGRLDSDPSVMFGFGYHGNGVNTATWAGKQLADWLGTAGADATEPPHWLPAVVRGSPGRFPLARLRLAYVQAAIAMLRFVDRRS